MNKRNLTIAALAVLAPAAVAAVLLSRAPAKAPMPAPAAPVAVQAAVPGAQTGVATSGAAEAGKAHAKLLAEAQNLQQPTTMPVPTAHSAGQPQAVAVEALEQNKNALPPVDAKNEVLIAFTSSVVGELDPCG